MLAALTSIKEIEIDKDEAKRLADASKKVMEFYPIGLNPKTIAIVNLVFVSSAIYTPRVMAYSVRKGRERQPKLVTPISGDKAAAAAAPGRPQQATGTAGPASAVFPTGNPYNTPVVEAED